MKKHTLLWGFSTVGVLASPQAAMKAMRVHSLNWPDD